MGKLVNFDDIHREDIYLLGMNRVKSILDTDFEVIVDLFDKYQQQKDIIKKQKGTILHFTYKPGGKGYYESKEHFDSITS